MKKRCDDAGPGPDRCLLEPDHEGWHKSNMHAWPNVGESMERWAAIGRRLMVEPMPWLSRKEMEYALDAAMWWVMPPWQEVSRDAADRMGEASG